ncbi:hypothetical protein BH11MYX4_BH11MYX4_46440 [soil metagenome]
MIVVANGGPAFAAPPKAAPKGPSAASRTYDEAGRALAAGNYEAALALYAKLPNVEARRGAALALDKLGRREEAIAEYEKFISGAPASLDEQVQAARGRVAELSAAKAVKVRVVTTPPGASIEVAGQPASGKTSPAELELKPGKYVIRATHPGSNQAAREIEVVASTPQEVSIERTPLSATGSSVIPASWLSTAAAPHPSPTTAGTPSPEAAPAPAPGIERLGAPIATGSAAVVALGAGIYFGLSALSKSSDYDSNPTEKGRADGQSAAAISTVGLTAGAILGAVTVVLLLTMPPADGPARSAAASGLRRDGLRLRF